MKIKIQPASLFFLIGFLYACVEGDTDDVAETVRSSDLGIETIALSKSHSDNLRAGRKVQIYATATLDSGTDQDISDEVSWSVSDASLLTHTGDGSFTALSGQSGSAIVTSSFAGIESEIAVVVSDALLESLEVEGVGYAGESDIALGACSELAFTALGKYEGEPDRDETLFVDWEKENGEFSSASFSNATANIEDGEDTSNVIKAKLDNQTSNAINLSYPEISDATLSISPADASNLVMGNQLTYSATWDNGAKTDVSSVVSWDPPVALNDGPPKASAVFQGAVLTAGYAAAKEVISENENYGVSVTASCSGKSSSVSDTVTINSDISDVAFSPSSNDGLAYGDELTITLSLTHEIDGELSASDIESADDIFWEILDNNSTYDADDYMTFTSTGKLTRKITINKENDIGSEFDFQIRVIYHGVEYVSEDDDFKMLEPSSS